MRLVGHVNPSCADAWRRNRGVLCRAPISTWTCMVCLPLTWRCLRREHPRRILLRHHRALPCCSRPPPHRHRSWLLRKVRLVAQHVEKLWRLALTAHCAPAPAPPTPPAFSPPPWTLLGSLGYVLSGSPASSSPQSSAPQQSNSASNQSPSATSPPTPNAAQIDPVVAQQLAQQQLQQQWEVKQQQALQLQNQLQAQVQQQQSQLVSQQRTDAQSWLRRHSPPPPPQPDAASMPWVGGSAGLKSMEFDAGLMGGVAANPSTRGRGVTVAAKRRARPLASPPPPWGEPPPPFALVAPPPPRRRREEDASTVTAPPMRASPPPRPVPPPPSVAAHRAAQRAAAASPAGQLRAARAGQAPESVLASQAARPKARPTALETSSTDLTSTTDSTTSTTAAQPAPAHKGEAAGPFTHTL